jgi:hypothetical protein
MGAGRAPAAGRIGSDEPGVETAIRHFLLRNRETSADRTHLRIDRVNSGQQKDGQHNNQGNRAREPQEQEKNNANNAIPQVV